MLPLPRKMDLLLITRKRLGELGEAWVEASVRGKQIDPGSPLVGEEWTTGPWALAAAINGYLESLRALAQGHMPAPKKVTTLPNGQLAVGVYPSNFFDWFMLNGISADVWMQPGVTAANLEQHQANFYKQKDPTGEVQLVLGAGNINAIPALNSLYSLYVLGHVVLLKMSPVNDYLGPVIEDIFAAYIQEGFLRLAYGGAEVGEYLARHEGIEAIHVTGSARTHDAIVFGSGPEGAVRKRENRPVIHKPVSSELGGVGPTVVVPGKWSRADIRFQAENVVTMKLHNDGFNCVATQVLVLAEEWEQREEFLDSIRQLLHDLPPRKAYYPGAAERLREALAAHPEAEVFGDAEPRVLITGLDSNADQEYCFTNEFFSAVAAQTSLPGKDPAEFLHNAVRFCNEKLYGTLGATLIVHPKTMRELGPGLEEAISDLRYGSVSINVWTAAAFLLSQGTWGAFPGHTYEDIQSGIGVVRNSYLFDKPEKTVSRGCFYPFPRSWLHGDPAFLPKPPWFVTNKTAHTTTKRVARFASDPGYRHLPGILWSALLG